MPPTRKLQVTLVTWNHRASSATPRLQAPEQYTIRKLVSLNRTVFAGSGVAAQASFFGCSAVELGQFSGCTIYTNSVTELVDAIASSFYSALVKQGNTTPMYGVSPFASEGKTLFGLLSGECTEERRTAFEEVGVAIPATGCHCTDVTAFVIEPAKRFRYLLANEKRIITTLLLINKRRNGGAAISDIEYIHGTDSE